MAIFNSYVSHHQRVNGIGSTVGPIRHEASEEEWEWQLHQEMEKCEELAVPSVNPRDPRMG